MVRLFFGQHRVATRLMVAGSEIADHERNSAAPASTAGQEGTKITTT